MGHLDAKWVKSWPALRASLCVDGKWSYLKPSIPLSLPLVIGLGILFALASWGLQRMLGSGYTVLVVGTAVGGLVGLCGHHLWRLSVPVVSIDSEHAEVGLGKGQPMLPLHRIAHLRLNIYADQWRGYREMELSVVLGPDGTEPKGYLLDRTKRELVPDDSDRRIVIFSRNNFDNDSFRFHADSPAGEMEDLARTLSGKTGLPIQIERKNQGDVLVDSFPG